MEKLRSAISFPREHTISFPGGIKILLSSHLVDDELNQFSWNDFVGGVLFSTEAEIGTRYFIELTSFSIYVRIVDSTFAVVLTRQKPCSLVQFDAVLDDISDWSAIYESIQATNDGETKPIVSPHELNQSLLAATSMHSVFLPEMKSLTSYFTQYDLYFKPKDSVGGDFYWSHTDDDRILVAIGDATGHGLEGAFGALFFLNMLSQLQVNTKTTIEDIVYYLQEGVDKQGEHSASESIFMLGCELVVCEYNPSSKEFSYIGCGIEPLLYQHGATAQLHKHTGGLGSKVKLPAALTPTSVKVATGDIIWLMSDGIKSQIGENGKAMGRKHLLEYVHALNGSTRPDVVKSFYENWRGTAVQTDDVCVLSLLV